MNKNELVDRVASAADVDKRTAERAVDAVVEAVIETTSAGDKLAIFGFGTFSQTSRAARTGRNPQTGAPVQIAASKGVKFAPASAFKSALNPKAAAKKAQAKKAGAKKASAKKAAKSTKKR